MCIENQFIFRFDPDGVVWNYNILCNNYITSLRFVYSIRAQKIIKTKQVILILIDALCLHQTEIGFRCVGLSLGATQHCGHSLKI